MQIWNSFYDIQQGFIAPTANGLKFLEKRTVCVFCGLIREKKRTISTVHCVLVKLPSIFPGAPVISAGLPGISRVTWQACTVQYLCVDLRLMPGYVGPGMATCCVMGSLFASPGPRLILEGLRAAGRGSRGIQIEIGQTTGHTAQW